MKFQEKLNLFEKEFQKKTKFYLLIFIVIRNIFGCGSENLKVL